MTELLGRQDCIKNLRQDLVDIQGAILDIFSRTGPVKFPSWKFPDKLSCDLDILTLLEEYDFVDGEHLFNQHCHIVLLELVIDRLLLLLQSASTYVGQQRGIQRKEQKGYLTVGHVVRNYFSHFVPFAKRREISKDIANQSKTKPSCIDKTQTTSINQTLINSSTRNSSAWSSLNAATLPSQITESSIPISKPKSPFQLKVNRHHVSCQTTKSLAICNACQQAQSLMRMTGHYFIDLLQSQGLPSSLQPLSKFVDAAIQIGCMTAGDIAQWSDEQLRDMRRLAKHLQDVKNTIQPLKDKLKEAATERKTLQSQFENSQSEFKRILETHLANISLLQVSLQKSQRSMKEKEERFQQMQQEVHNEMVAMIDKNNKLKREAALQRETAQLHECEKNLLEEQLRKLQTERETHARLQETVRQLETRVSETQLLLDKENVKYQSACRQQESMQSKQKSLLQRVDSLDKECEELQQELGEKEAENMKLVDNLEETSEKNKQLQTVLTHQQKLCREMQKDKQRLEAQVDELKKHEIALTGDVKALQERERLLVAFPELNNWTRAQQQSTGDILLDMQEQMKANNIRRKVLEQENATLENCIAKLHQKAQQSATRECFPQDAVGMSSGKQQHMLAKEFIGNRTAEQLKYDAAG